MKKILLSLTAVIWSLSASAEDPEIPHLVPDRESLKIAFMTDIHVQKGLPSDSLIRVAINEVNASDCDFVLLGGDYVYTGYDADIRNAYKHIKRIRKPWFAILGNHEVVRTDNACKTYRKLFGYDRRVVFRAGNYLFVGFDAGPYNRATTAIVRAEDLAWLEEQFRSARPGERIICVCHIPLDKAISNYREVTALMRKYGVKAQICGHAHTTLMLNVDSIPAAMGRKLDLTEKKYGAGYNIIELKDDSIYLWQKRLDQRAPRLFYKARQGFSPDVLKFKTSPLPVTEKSFDQVGAEIVRDFHPAVYAGALVRNGKAYVGHSDGTLHAIDVSDGHDCWSYDMGDILCATPVWFEGRVITVSPTGVFTAFDAETGRIMWQLEAKGPVVGDPLVKDGMLYCGFGVGYFAKIDPEKGRPVWITRYGNLQMQCLPAVSEGHVVITTWENDVRCLDDLTGREQWRWYSGSDRFDFTPGLIFPRIARGKVFVQTINKEMAVLDAATGKLIWRDDMGSCRKPTGISSDASTVYTETRNADIMALNASRDYCAVKWTAKTDRINLDRNACEIITYNGVLYMAATGGWIAAISEKDGRVLWEHRFSDTECNNLTADGGYIWAMFLDGKLFRIPAAGQTD